MGIGKRHPVQVIQLVTAQTPDGNWSNNVEGQKFGVFAEIDRVGGFRDYNNGQTQLGATRSFLIRFKFDRYPGADWKIRYEGKDWEVQQMERVDEKRFYWRFVAMSKSNVQG